MSYRGYKSGIIKGTSSGKVYTDQQTSRQLRRRYKQTLRRNPPRIPTNVEKKGVDTELTLSPIIDTTSTNGSCFTLNLIQAGTGSFNRIGKSVKLSSVRIKGSFTWTLTPAATTGVYRIPAVRMVLVWDHQPSGVLATFDTVFGHTVQTNTESTTVSDSIRYDNMDRFQILRDCTYTPPMFALASGNSNAITITQPIDEYVKLKGRKSIFSGQSNPMTIADVSTGALLLYFRMIDSDGTNFASVNDDTVARLRYVDK